VYLYIPDVMYWASCRPHTDQILPKLPAQQSLSDIPHDSLHRDRRNAGFKPSFYQSSLRSDTPVQHSTWELFNVFHYTNFCNIQLNLWKKLTYFKHFMNEWKHNYRKFCNKRSDRSGGENSSLGIVAYCINPWW